MHNRGGSKTPQESYPAKPPEAMWKDFIDSATEKLEKAGDVLTEKATAAAAAAAAADRGPTVVAIPGEGSSAGTGQGPSLATPPVLGQSFSRFRDNLTSLSKTGSGDYTTPQGAGPNGDKMLADLKKGWGSVMDSAQKAAEKAREAVEKEQTRLQATFAKGPYRRGECLYWCWCCGALGARGFESDVKNIHTYMYLLPTDSSFLRRYIPLPPLCSPFAARWPSPQTQVCPSTSKPSATPRWSISLTGSSPWAILQCSPPSTETLPPTAS